MPATQWRTPGFSGRSSRRRRGRFFSIIRCMERLATGAGTGIPNGRLKLKSGEQNDVTFAFSNRGGLLAAVAGFVAGFLVLPSLAGFPPGAHVEQSQAAFTDYKREVARHHPQDHTRRTCRNRTRLNRRIIVRTSCRAPGACLAPCAAWIHGHGIRNRAHQSAPGPEGAQWRSVRGRKRAGPHSRAARAGSGRQGSDRFHLCRRVDAALWHRVLSTRSASAICVRGQYRLRGALRLSRWRPESARARRKRSFPIFLRAAG